jgi:apolipoprotein N-acyltransferase
MRWGQGWGRLAWATAAVMWGLAAGLVVASQHSGSAHTVAHGPVLPLVLLQGNIAQDEKFQASTGLPQALAWYGQRLAGRLDVGQAAAGHLIVAPETALPLLPQQLGPEFWQPVLNGITTHGHAVLTGLPLGSAAQGYANAAWGITPEMAVAGQAHLVADGSPAGLPVHRYDKHHLVPFGEFIPPLFRWFVDLMHIPLGDFNRGALGQTPLLWGGQRIAPHICYEDLFGEELARGFVADPNTAPTVLLNISNLGWFGNTVALNQHLHISRLRARELGRPVVRATNTGATVVINAQGHITHALPRLSRGELHAQVQGHTGLTPYAEWVGRWGLWPWPILSALILVGAARARRAQSQRG